MFPCSNTPDSNEWVVIRLLLSYLKHADQGGIRTRIENHCPKAWLLLSVQSSFLFRSTSRNLYKSTVSISNSDQYGYQYDLAFICRYHNSKNMLHKHSVLATPISVAQPPSPHPNVGQVDIFCPWTSVCFGNNTVLQTCLVLYKHSSHPSQSKYT